MSLFNDEPYIRATVLIAYKDEMRRQGCDPLELMTLAGLPVNSILNPDSFISYRLVCELFELAAAHLKNPNFGMDRLLNADNDFPAAGPLVMLGRFTNDLRGWTQLALKYWNISTNGFKIEMIENVANHTATYRFYMDPLSQYSRQMAELLVGNAFGIIRVVSEQDKLKPRFVRFKHIRPQSIEAHSKFFQCPIEFDAEHNEVVFDRDILSVETSGRLRILKPMLGIYVRHRVRHLPQIDDSIKSHISLAIGSLLGSGNCSMETIAAGLGMSSKKLHRLLEKEDITFSSIVDEVRQNTARHLLVDSNASIARISALLDYSSNPAFTLAFKRWTGVSPLKYRKIERERIIAQLRSTPKAVT